MAFNWKRIMIQEEVGSLRPGLFHFTVAEDGGYTFDLVIPEANKMFTEAITPDQVIQRYPCSNRQALWPPIFGLLNPLKPTYLIQ